MEYPVVLALPKWLFANDPVEDTSVKLFGGWPQISKHFSLQNQIIYTLS
jgi:hypothetical protein